MAFTEIDEKLLVRAYQAGDDRAFDTIVRTQYNALYAHALRRLSQHEAAEDAVQDTMLRAYRALPNLDGDLALRAWLHRILTNVCHDEGNRRRRQQGLVEKVGALPEEVAEDPVEEAVLHDTVRVMSEALQDLPDSYREALVLRYVDGLSFREVAEATGVSEENARARVHRGRVALHKVMSRVMVMVAFIIPGLKKTQAATPPAPDSAVAVSDHAANAVNLTTQLTSHVMTAAPTVSRLADVAGGMPAGTKSAIAAAAMTAVASVAVPVAVHVQQDSKRPSASANQAVQDRGTGDKPIVGPSGKTFTSTPTTTLGATPTSVAEPQDPFEAGAAITTPTTVAQVEPSTTTTSTTVPPAPPVEQGPMVEGRLSADTLTVTGTAPQWDVQGSITLNVNGKTTTGTVSGRVFVREDEGTAESTGLNVTLGGKTLELKFSGRITDATGPVGARTYKITARYAFLGGSEFGLADHGDVNAVFRTGSGSSLSFDLRGRASS